MRLVTAHKGKLALRATLHGSARHSSEAPLADNAVERAAELVLALRDRGRELAAAAATAASRSPTPPSRSAPSTAATR